MTTHVVHTPTLCTFVVGADHPRCPLLQKSVGARFRAVLRRAATRIALHPGSTDAPSQAVLSEIDDPFARVR